MAAADPTVQAEVVAGRARALAAALAIADGAADHSVHQVLEEEVAAVVQDIVAGEGWQVASYIHRLEVESEASVAELANWDVEIVSAAIEPAAYCKDSAAVVEVFVQDLRLATSREHTVADTGN